MGGTGKRDTGRHALDVALYRIAIALAYCGGAVIAFVSIVLTISIAGRSLWSSPVFGDFEMAEIGVAVSGSLFLAYCQATRGHIVVDFFTLRARRRTVRQLDRAGALLMALVLLLIAWRTGVGCYDIYRSGETSMLMAIPIWIGYAAAIPGVCFAGFIALAQAAGLVPLDRGEAEDPAL